MQKTNFELITSIYQNADTGIRSIKDIMSSVKDSDLKKELYDQIDGYEIIINECKKISKNKNIELKDNSWFEKSKLFISIKMSTLFNKSTRHIAEMLLLGTVMGTVQCYKDLKDFDKCSEQYLLLLKKLLEKQEQFFNNFKNYL